MFDLEGNRVRFSWWIRKINGFSWALDNKKAYGYRKRNYRTVMPYGNDRTRVHFHSDSQLRFPDSHPAGDHYARTRSILNSHITNVIAHNDSTNLFLNNEVLNATQTSKRFAFSKIEASNYTVNNHARLELLAQNNIILKPGIHLKRGAETTVKIFNCQNTYGRSPENAKKKSDEVYNANEKKLTINTVFKVYPNPATDKLVVMFDNNEIKTNIELAVYTINGELKLKKIYQNLNILNEVLDITHFSSGKYIVSIKTPTFKKSRKIIVK